MAEDDKSSDLKILGLIINKQAPSDFTERRGQCAIIYETADTLPPPAPLPQKPDKEE